MQVVGFWLATRATRVVLGAAALVTMAALQPEPARHGAATAARAGAHARALVLSEQARRYLLLQYRAYPTEFMGCMIGTVYGNAVFVRRIAPADVEPGQSTPTHVLPKQSCEDAGWTGTVGMIHSHPGGERCWYFFPGTEVASSDAHSFARQPYPVDAIMCGDRVVWISRDMVQQQVVLVPPREPAPGRPRRGMAHVGAASAVGGD
ncbi:MAG TPA: hypothetical protein VEU55_03530 [Gemmatimonadales bacterium]|nr:hypothetical protein [Gemmatimonadales bacterium]